MMQPGSGEVRLTGTETRQDRGGYQLLKIALAED
jgi:hypothetical protein